MREYLPKNKMVGLILMIISLLIILLVTNVLASDIPFYMQEASSQNRDELLSEIEKGNNEEHVYQLTTNIQVVMVKDTSLSMEGKGHNIVTQGQYYIDTNTGKVIYCLDPTVLVGNGTDYLSFKELNDHAFSSLDKETQIRVSAISEAGNNLYNETKDENYLVMTQYLIWEQVGMNILSFNDGLIKYKEDILKAVDQIENQDSLAANNTYLDTSGQDLILGDNAPSIDKDNDEIIIKPELTDSKPEIAALNNVYNAGKKVSGETLINLESLKPSDFKAVAYDREDGTLTNKIKITDTSSVNVTKPGVYPVTLSVEDSDGNVASTTEKLIIVNDYTTFGKGTMMQTSDGITQGYDKAEKMSNQELAKLYQNVTNPYAYSLTGENIKVTTKVVDKMELNKNPDLPSMLIVTVENKAVNGNETLTKQNKLFVTDGNIGDYTKNPYLYAENVELKVGETFENSMLNAYAYDIATQTDLTDKIKYNTNKVDTSKSGVYPVSLSVKNANGKETKINVSVSVIEDNSSLDEIGMFNADDIYTNVDSISSSANVNDFIINNSNPQVISKDGEELDAKISIKNTNLQKNSKVGVYSATLIGQVKDETIETTINIYVANGNEIVDKTNPYLYAENIRVKLNDKVTNDMFNATAFDKQDGDLTSEIVYPTKVNTSKTGVYPVDLIVKDKDNNVTKKTVTVTVTDSDSIISPNNKVFLTASNFTVSESDVHSASDINEFILTNADARAYAIEDGKLLNPEVMSTTLKADAKTGTYVATIGVTFDGEYVEKEIVITVTNTIIKINAEDIFTNEKELSSVSDINEFILEKSKAKTNELDLPINVKTTDVASDSKAGVYTATLITEKDGKEINKEITIYVANGNDVIDKENPYLTANNIKVKQDTIVTNDMYGAIAFDKQDGNLTNSIIYETVDTTTIGVKLVKISVTDKDGNTTTITSYVTVVSDDTVISPDGKIMLDAKDIYSNQKELAKASEIEQFILEQSKAQAFVMSNGQEIPVKVKSTELKLDSQPGVYKATLMSEFGGSKVTKEITIYLAKGDENIDKNNPYLYASNVRVKLNEKVTNDMFKATAFDKQDGDLTTSITYPTVDTKTIGVEPAVLSVTDKDGNETTRTVYVTVTSDDTVISPNNQLMLDAKDIYTTESELAKNSNIDDFIIDNSHAVAFNMETGRKLDVNVQTDLTLSSPFGVYQVELSAEENGEQVSKEINVFVAKDNDIIDQDKPYLSANNVKVNQNDVVTNEMFGATAFDKQDGDLTGSIVYPTVDTSKVGVKAAVLSVTDKDGNTSTFTSYVTVVGDDSVISPDEKVMLDANDIFTTEADVTSAKDINDFIVSESNAFAQNMVDGSDVTVDVDSTTLASDSKAGVYEAKLSATVDKDKAEKTISIYVAKDSDVIDNDKPYLTANNIKVNQNDVVTNAMFGAIAFDKQDGDLTSSIDYPTVDTSKVGVKAVTLSVTDKDSNTTTFTSYVTVVGDDSVISPDEKVMLDAEDVYTTEADVTSTKDINDFIISESNAFAQNMVDGSDVTVDVDSTTLASDSKAGVYEAKLSATVDKDKAEKTISIYVAKGSDVIDNDKPYLTANNIKVNQNDSVTDDLYGAVAFDKQDGDLTSSITYPTVDTSKVGVKPATLSVTDKDGNTTTFTSYVTVVGGDSVISPDEKVMLNASDFKLTELQVSGLTDVNQAILKNANAKAWDMNTGSDVAVTVESTDLTTSAKAGDYKAVLKADNGEDSVTKEIKITVTDVAISLSADDIYTNEDEISSQSDIEEFIINNANVVASESSKKLNPTTVKVTDLTTTSTYGTYSATIEVTNEVESTEVRISIYVAKGSDVIDNDKPYLTANNVKVDLNDSVTDDLYGAVAFDKQDGDVTSSIVYPTVDTSKAGVKPAVLSVTDKDGNTTTFTSYVTVVGDDSVISPDEKVMLDANDIFTTEADVTSTKDINDFIISESNAFAQNMVDGSDVAVDVDSTTLASDSKAGVYEAKLSATVDKDKAEKTISIYVAKDSDVIDNDKPYLTANNIKVNQNDVVTNVMFGAVAFDKQDGDLTSSIVYPTVDTSKAGVKPAVLSVTDKDSNITTFTSYVTVVGDDSVISPDEKVMLDANDIFTTEADVTSAKDINDFIVSESNAFAQNMVDGSDVTVDVDSTTLASDSKAGVYEAKLSATVDKDKAEKTISIYVAKDSDVIDNDKPYLTANNVKVDLNDPVTDDLYGAVAFDKQDGDLTGSITYPTVDTSKVGVKPAVLSITDKDGNTTTFTSYVTVIGDNTVISPDEKVMLDAEDVYTTEADVTSTKDINDFIISESNAFAKNMVDGSDVTVDVDSTTLASDSKAGVYEAKLSATVDKDKAEKTISIYVAKDSDVIDNDKPYLTANNIKVNQNDVVTNAMFGAVAFDKQDGDLTSSVVYPTVDTSKVGVKPVVLSVTDKDSNTTTFTSYVTVVGGDSVISPDEKVMLDASDFKLTELQVNGLTDVNQAILTNANAKAWDMNTGNDVAVTVESTDLTTSAKAGDYKAVLKADNGEDSVTKEIKITVTDVAINLSADDIYTNEDEISAQSDIEEFIINNANVVASESSKKLNPTTVKVTDLTTTSTYGTYSATIEVTNEVESTEVRISIYVAKGSDVIDKDKPYLTANDVKVDLNDSVTKDLYGAVAFDKQDGDVTSSIVYPTVDTSKVGVKPATLSVTDKDGNTTTFTSYVTVVGNDSVISPDEKVMLDASDFKLTELQVNGLTDVNQAILKNANAKAWDMNTGSDVAVTVESTDLTTSAKAGDYKAVLKADNGADSVTKEIKITVTDVAISLSADDIYTNEDEISAQSDIEEFIINNANVVASESSKKLNPTTVKITDLTTTSTAGKYTATIEVTNEIESVEVGINIYVAKGSDVIDKDKPYLTANNVKVDLNDSVTNDLYGALAFDKQDGDLTGSITYPTVDTTTAGVKPAVLSVTDKDGNTTTFTSYVTVIGDDSVISPDEKVMLDANDIFTTEADVTSTKDINDFIISESNAFAQNMVDGSDVAVDVDSTTLASDSKAGVYEAKLSATVDKDKAEKTISIYVAKDSDVIDNDKPYLTANNIKVDLNDPVTDDLYGAVAFDKQDGNLTTSITYPTVDTSKVGVKPAVLSVTDKDGNTTTFTSYVTVVGDDSVISPDEKVMLDANDIFTTEADVTSAKDINDFIVSESNAFAQNMVDGSDVTVDVDSTTLASDSKAGVYEAKLSATVDKDKAEKTISIYVAKDSDVIDNDKPYLTANNIKVNQNDVVTNAMFGAVAFDKEDGDLTSSVVYPTVDTSKVGVKPVVLSVTDKDSNTTTFTSYVTVVGGDSVISPDEKVMLDASDFKLTELQVNGLADVNQAILTNANAKAWDMNTGNDVAVTVESTDLTTSAKAGDYKAVLKADNGEDSVTKEIKITVTDVAINLSADDIYTNEDEISAQSDIEEFIINNANVVASESSKKLNPTTVKVTDLTTTSTYGTYSATIEVTNEIESVEVRINIYVAKGSDVIDKDKPYLTANNVKVDLNDSVTKDLYGAVAFDKQDGDVTSSIVYPTVDTSKVGVKPATLSVTDKDGNTTTFTSYVTVVGGDSVISPDEKVMLDASDFKLTELQVNGLADVNQAILTNANAKAWDMNTGNDVAVTVESTDLTTSAKAGDYKAVLKADNGEDSVTKEIKITVTDVAISLSADDIYTNEDEISSQSDIEEFIINNANVVASESSKKLNPTTVKVTDLTTTSTYGTYSATIEVTNEIESVEVGINIYVAKGSDVIDDDKPYLTANNLIVDQNDVVTNDMFGAVAFDKQDGDLTSSITYPTVDTTKVGVQVVKLSVSDKDGNITTKTVTVATKGPDTDISPDEKLMINASDFELTELTVNGITDINDAIITNSNAKGYDLETGDELAVTVESTDLTTSSKVGEYKAVLKITNGKEEFTKEIKISVIDIAIDLNANDIYTNEDEISSQSNIEEFIIKQSGVDAEEVEVKTLNPIIVKATDLTNTSTYGTYSATFEVTNEIESVEKTITIYVAEGNDVIDDTKPYLFANNLIVDQNDIVTDDMFGAVAYDKQDGDLTSSIVYPTIDTTVSGVQKTSLHVTDSDLNTTSVDVTVTVIGDDSIISPDNSLYLQASDVFTNEKELSNATDLNQFIIDNANAVAQVVETGEMLDVDVVDTTLQLDSKLGIYQATVSTTKDKTTIKKTIDIYVAKNDDLVDKDNPYLAADNITVDLNVPVTNDMYNAIAFDRQDGDLTGSIVYPTVDTSKEGVQIITLSVTDSDGNITNLPVKVIVKDSGSVISPDQKVLLNAQDIYTNEKDLSKVVDINDYIIKESKAFAQSTVDASILPVDVDKTTLTPTSTVGVYTATLSATYDKDTATKDINIYVADDGDVIDDDKPYLTANNIKVNQYDTVTNDMFGAVAFDKEDGDLSGSIVYPTVDTTVDGVFKKELSVTDSAGNTVTKTVMVTVLGENGITDPTENIYLSAENIYTNENTIKGIGNIDEYILTASNARAFDMQTADVIVPTVKSTNLTPTSIIGEYEAVINATNSVQEVDKKIKIIVLPNSDLLPVNDPYVYAEDVELNIATPGNEKYDVSMHNVFAYDRQDGNLTSKVTSVGSDKVDETTGNKYPVDFSVQDSDGNKADKNTIVTVNMAPIKISAKFNAMNLDAKIQLDLSNYISETRFTYKMIVREGGTTGEGNKISENAVTPGNSKYENITGDKLKIEPDKTYNIGIYEVGPGREYLIDGFEYKAPKIDPGPDGIVYSTGDSDGDGKDDTSYDNVGYIENIYQFESIGYEESPQPGRIEFVENSAVENENDLTITKYQRSYRPFDGNYRLDSDIDASATKNDTLSDAEGGFGTDGFKPIGYKFTSKKAQGGTGFDSEFADSFTGTFDGNNHTISNLYMYRGKESKNSKIAIFGKVGEKRNMTQVKADGPNIFDLKIVDASILTPNYNDVAILVGINDGYIKNVEVTGNVMGKYYVAGVAGQNGENSKNAVGLMENIVFNGRVESALMTTGDLNISAAGGIIGFNRYGSELKYSSSHGSIDGDDNIGGLVGRGEGDIINSFSTMDVEIGSNSGGGIIGYGNSGETDISNTYFDGSVRFSEDGGMGVYVGGIAGWNDGFIDHSFSQAVLTGRDNIGGISGPSNGGRTDKSITINSQILDNDGIGATGYVNDRHVGNDNYYTSLSQIYKSYGKPGEGTINGSQDNNDSKEVSNLELTNKSWWINLGYTEADWDFSGLSSGFLPKLKDGDGNVLPYQPDIGINYVPKK